MGQTVTPGVAIIGCGLIGQKRAAALAGARLAVCADLNRGRADALANRFSAEAVDDWRAAVDRRDVDIVIVATTNETHADVTRFAAKAGKHVLVEKPAALNAAQIDPLIEEAKRRKLQVRVGYNHRYHPAFRMAAPTRACRSTGRPEPTCPARRR